MVPKSVVCFHNAPRLMVIIPFDVGTNIAADGERAIDEPRKEQPSGEIHQAPLQLAMTSWDAQR